MSIQHMRLVIEYSCTRGADRAIMLALAFRANEGGLAWPSLKRLAADAGLSRRTVARRLPHIHNTGELFIQHRRRAVNTRGGRQEANLYRITLKPPKGGDRETLPGKQVVSACPKGSVRVTPQVVSACPKGSVRVTPEPKENDQYEPKEKGNARNRLIDISIEDYEDILNPEHDAIAVALAVTGENGNRQAEGFYRKALKAIGPKAFRQAVAELWGEMKTDNIRKPGAILTNKLKALMEATP